MTTKYNSFEFESTPKPMNYLETITSIANHNKITLKDAITKYYDLTGIPSKEIYEVIMKEDEIIPYGLQVKISNNADILDYWGIPLELSGKDTKVVGIDIKSDPSGIIVYYHLQTNNYLYFGLPTLVKKRI